MHEEADRERDPDLAARRAAEVRATLGRLLRLLAVEVARSLTTSDHPPIPSIGARPSNGAATRSG